jgi:hypothetical protein
VIGIIDILSDDFVAIPCFFFLGKDSMHILIKNGMVLIKRKKITFHLFWA